MINRIECSRDEDDGKLTIRMFEESSGLVGVAKTALAAKHIFDTYGGPASTIHGVVPESHDNFWSKICNLL